MADPKWYVVFLYPSGRIVAHPANTDQEADAIERKAGNWFSQTRVPAEAVVAGLIVWFAATACPATSQTAEPTAEKPPGSLLECTPPAPSPANDPQGRR